MARIRTRQQRIAAERERLAQVSRVLLEATPAEARVVAVSLHVAGEGEQLPRIPIVGLEAGAIRGTIPHRSRVMR